MSNIRAHTQHDETDRIGHLGRLNDGLDDTITSLDISACSDPQENLIAIYICCRGVDVHTVW